MLGLENLREIKYSRKVQGKKKWKIKGKVEEKKVKQNKKRFSSSFKK